MHHPLVSVIIPVYNRAHLIREALESVAAQEYPALEIVLVDDGSRDVEMLRQVVDDFAATFAGDVRLVHQANAGAGAARNHGLRVSKGDYIQYLDSDDLLLPGKIRTQVEALQGDSEAVMCYGVAIEELPGGGQKERRMARDFSPDLLEATLQWRRWHTSGALWRYPDVAGWRNHDWWSLSRVGQDVVHDVRVGCVARKILFVDAPSILARLVTQDHTSHSPKPEMIRARHQVVEECEAALREAGLLGDPRYALPFAERCFHTGLFLAVHGQDELARDLLHRAQRHYPQVGLKLDPFTMRAFHRLTQLPFLRSGKARLLRAAYRLRRNLRPASLHFNKGV